MVKKSIDTAINDAGNTVYASAEVIAKAIEDGELSRTKKGAAQSPTPIERKPE